MFTALFTLEIVLKSIAHGLVLHRGAYLRNGWNDVDFIVVLASLLNLALSSFDISFVRTLRLLRCLRPLRVISRNPGMKLVVNALFMSVTGILNVVGVLLLVWLMFAILGVQVRVPACRDTEVCVVLGSAATYPPPHTHTRTHHVHSSAVRGPVWRV